MGMAIPLNLPFSVLPFSLLPFSPSPAPVIPFSPSESIPFDIYRTSRQAIAV